LSIVFEYAEIFRPALVCIDDIDLIVGSRDGRLDRVDLSSALQALNGFVTGEETYFIATTNDRTLLDFALKRPGRFDLIVEFSSLEPEFYLSLVRRETGDENIIRLFTDKRVVKKLRDIQATGAFIVSLLRYLRRPRFDDRRHDVETLLSVIEILYNSFKAEIQTQNQKIGF